MDASFLAGLVATHQISEEEALRIGLDLVSAMPARAFTLERYL
jgi:hypothetical protein